MQASFKLGSAERTWLHDRDVALDITSHKKEITRAMEHAMALRHGMPTADGRI